jgi:hypothetical protein
MYRKEVQPVDLCEAHFSFVTEELKLFNSFYLDLIL